MWRPRHRRRCRRPPPLQSRPGAVPKSHDVRRRLRPRCYLSNLRQPLLNRLQALLVGWAAVAVRCLPAGPPVPLPRDLLQLSDCHALTTLCQLAACLPPPSPPTHRWGVTSWCKSLAGFKRVRTVLPNSCSFCIKDVSGWPGAVWGSQVLAMQHWRLWRRSCCRLPAPLSGSTMMQPPSRPRCPPCLQQFYFEKYQYIGTVKVGTAGAACRPKSQCVHAGPHWFASDSLVALPAP